MRGTGANMYVHTCSLARSLARSLSTYTYVHMYMGNDATRMTMRGKEAEEEGWGGRRRREGRRRERR